MAHFPEIRVLRSGRGVTRVQWDPCRDGEPLFDLTGMRVSKVESVIDAAGVSEVKVTFMARLVDVDVDRKVAAL